MRSRMSCNISSGELHRWTLNWLLEARLIGDHGWLCTASVLLNLVVRAAARSTSISATCRELVEGPSAEAALTAVAEELPKTFGALERRLHEALTGRIPRRMRRRRWQVAIDWHYSPYYGQHSKSRNEICAGPMRQGTTKFHSYATACIVDRGQRYTVALTYVRRRESKVKVLRRLIEQIRGKELNIKCVLLDRDFFNVSVIHFLQTESLPFLMPVYIRGKRPRRGSKVTGLRWIQRQSAGWYSHTISNRKIDATIRVCVGYRRHKNRKDGKQVTKKLLFAAWRMHGTPTEIRNRYRKRFGIETSYRQMRQARIRTSTRCPRLRLFFLAVALIMRNLWVWIHATKLASAPGASFSPNLAILRFRQMLEAIALTIYMLFLKPDNDLRQSLAEAST